MIDNKSYKLLKLFYRKKMLTFSQVKKFTGLDEIENQSKYISCLIENNYIFIEHGDDLVDYDGVSDFPAIGYRITLEGEAYVQERRRNGRSFWVPYIITTCIALISLIASLSENWSTILSWFCRIPE